MGKQTNNNNKTWTGISPGKKITQMANKHEKVFNHISKQENIC